MAQTCTNTLYDNLLIATSEFKLPGPTPCRTIFFALVASSRGSGAPDTGSKQAS